MLAYGIVGLGQCRTTKPVCPAAGSISNNSVATSGRCNCGVSDPPYVAHRRRSRSRSADRVRRPACPCPSSPPGGLHRQRSFADRNQSPACWQNRDTARTVSEQLGVLATVTRSGGHPVGRQLLDLPSAAASRRRVMVIASPDSHAPSRPTRRRRTPAVRRPLRRRHGNRAEAHLGHRRMSATASARGPTIWSRARGPRPTDRRW